MTGAEYVAEFLARRNSTNIFLITGGACAFVVDAVARHPKLKYHCFQHEQAAAMAADSLWRTNRVVGVTVATSGPGATNLITGIACSYFDSIPTLHITGQVNQNEKKNYNGAKVRQAGFQETKIVEMVKPITKYAVQVTNGKELKDELEKAYNIAITGRMGPVLIDIPMDVQKEEVGDEIQYSAPKIVVPAEGELSRSRAIVAEFFRGSERPLVLFGAGVGLAGAESGVESWLNSKGLPFVASWNALTYFNHEAKGYLGNIGVYGNRGANFALQSADRILVLGSRLDNRQRSGDTDAFGLNAKFLVVDVDDQELAKYPKGKYSTISMDLRHISKILDGVAVPRGTDAWAAFVHEMKGKYFGKYPSTTAEEHGTLSPYWAVQSINRAVAQDAIVIADDGANLCWVFQTFHRTKQTLYTAGGNSPMGYSFPAAIGAAIQNPGRQVVAFTGDGSMQMNIQELQTLKYNDLNVKVVILNNFGYGIIKQFQDLYFQGRYHGSDKGYSQPDFGKVVSAYGIPYLRVEKTSDLDLAFLSKKGPGVIDVYLHPNTLIEPKLEMGRPIHDQFPYLNAADHEKGTRLIRNYARTGE